jgi:hypothetical protein
MIENNTFSI